MLPYSTDTRPLRICSIDPGSDTMGISFLDVDIWSNRIIVVSSVTIKASRQPGLYEHLADVRGTRRVRIDRLGETFFRLLCAYRPDLVVAESPYMGRFVTAFEALVECRLMIREVLWSYDRSMTLQLVEPTVAKQAVGAIVKKGSKENVRDSVLILEDLEWAPDVPAFSLDEHSIDSIAVGYAKAKEVIAYWRR